MKHILKKIKSHKSPTPPRQPIPPETPADIAAGPPSLRAELPDITIPGDGGRNASDNDLEADRTDLTVLPNEGGKDDGINVGQELPASGASTPGVAIGGAGYEDQLASKCSRSLRRTQHSRASVFLPPLAEGSSDTGGETGTTETSTGT